MGLWSVWLLKNFYSKARSFWGFVCVNFLYMLGWWIVSWIDVRRTEMRRVLLQEVNFVELVELGFEWRVVGVKIAIGFNSKLMELSGWWLFLVTIDCFYASVPFPCSFSLQACCFEIFKSGLRAKLDGFSFEDFVHWVRCFYVAIDLQFGPGTIDNLPLSENPLLSDICWVIVVDQRSVCLSLCFIWFCKISWEKLECCSCIVLADYLWDALGI